MTKRPLTPHEHYRRLRRRMMFRLVAKALLVATWLWVFWSHGGIGGKRDLQLFAVGGGWAAAVTLLAPPSWQQRPIIHWTLMMAPAIMIMALQAM